MTESGTVMADSPPGFRSLPNLGAGLVVVVVMMVTATMVALDARRDYAERRAQVLETVSGLAGRLQEIIHARISLAHGLSAVVRASSGKVVPEQFQMFAEHLRHDLSDIRSLQLAPDGVVTHIYPFESNQKALGHDIRRDPKRAAAVERAIRDRSYVIAGPFELIQGGTAMVARLPIHLPDETRADGRFWGFATVVLDMEPLLRVGGINAVEGLAVALRGRDGLGAEGEVFYGDPAVFGSEPVLAEIGLPNGRWLIGAVPRGGWTLRSYASIAIWVGGIAIALLGASLTYLLLARPQRLRRAVAIATAELEHSRRRAEALSLQARHASDDKTWYLATVSHDLQQPLAAMRLFLGVLSEQALSDASRNVVDKMQATVQWAIELIESLTQAAALDSGKVRPRMTQVAVRGVLRQLGPAHHQSAARKGLALDVKNCRRPDCRGLGCSDPLLLRRILGNLVGNAVRYADRGRVRIRCHCRDDRTLIFVGDTGPGIAPDALPRIFDEFYRGDSRTGGYGLGLAIVAKLAAVLGHKVTVRSRLGSGTVFMVVVDHCPPPSPAVSGKNVLLVEEDADQLFALQELLEDMGLTVIPAVSAAEALAQLESLAADPDLLVADDLLAGEAAAAAKLRHDLGAIPSVTLTSDAAQVPPRMPAHHRILRKPVSPQEFLETVRAMLSA